MCNYLNIPNAPGRGAEIKEGTHWKYLKKKTLEIIYYKKFYLEH